MRSVLPLTALFSVLAFSACSGGTQETPPPEWTTTRIAAKPSQASDSYYQSAAAAVANRYGEDGVKPAKNVILFVGDGMGISTITAGRIYAGQKKGVDGVSYRLAMETLPHVALSKTYSHDFQVSDSASTATAMVTGVKTRTRALGITQNAQIGDCASADGNHADSLFDLAERAGLATGIVTTTRVTHATPASTYSHSVHRNWEDDTEIPEGQKACNDIAAQLIDWPEGDGFEVVLGGGRRHLLPADVSDPEDEDGAGRRVDGRNLIDEWQAKSNNHLFVWNRNQFNDADLTSGASIMGLFEQSHMEYELDRPEDTALEPSIAEMTAAAITRLSQDEDGYVLLVEGGRIDHAHHGVNAARAMEDTVAFDDAVAAALEMTNAEDTLIIVTADHSHTMTISGYQARNNPILETVILPDGTELKAADGKPYTTLGYANGQSACTDTPSGWDCEREDLTEVDTTSPNYRQQARVPLASETHGGEDVAIFATGPGSELVRGVMEQNEIFHVMGKASGLVE